VTTFSEGQPVALPFSVSDDDGDEVNVMYKFKGDAEWSAAPVSSALNVFPYDLLARGLATAEASALHLTAFDGLEDSESPLVLGSDTGSWELSLSVFPTSRDVATYILGKVPEADRTYKLTISGPGSPFFVWYAVDDSKDFKFLKQLGNTGDVVVPAEVYPPFRSKPLSITFKVHPLIGPSAYATTSILTPVNSPVRLFESMLPFRPSLSGSVTLPIGVSADAGDGVRVRYGFNTAEPWSYASESSTGTYTVPGVAFQEHFGPGDHLLHVSAVVGQSESETVSIPYTILEVDQAAPPVEAEADGSSGDGNVILDAGRIGTLVGIGVGVFAVIVLAVSVSVYLYRRRKEVSVKEIVAID
jgi:hypothetical protein